MRTYEATHPWLNFSLDTRELNYTTWLLLGEAVSKVEHIAGVPLKPEFARDLHSVYLAKGALATSAIEGNTLTEEEVRDHIDGHLELPPSRQYLGQEIENIVEACNSISDGIVRGNSGPITVDEILEFNRLVLRDLPLNEDVVPGELRLHSVMVGRYRAAPAEDCAYLLNQYGEWLNALDPPAGLERPYAILTAITAHLFFVWIHPFGDGNGRTARLIEFRYLLQAGFPTPAAHLLSNFYNLTRTEYYRQLDQAGRSGGQIAGFLDYATQGLVDQLREQLNVIRQLQWDTTWQNHVYEQFRRISPAQMRRRRIVLELSKVSGNDGWVQSSDVLDLSSRLAQEFFNKTPKTLSRDLNAISEMGLIERRGRSVRANKQIILAFLPARAPVNPAID